MSRKINYAKPVKMWIDGTCVSVKRAQLATITDDQLKFSKNQDGTVSAGFHLPMFYYKKLLSDKRFSLNLISQETETKIKIPNLDEKENLKFTSSSEENIKKAVSKALEIIIRIRDMAPMVQFVSIPLIGEEIRSNFLKFKKEIVDGERIEGLHESIFVKPEKLHITVNVFSLLSEKEINAAQKALREYKKDILLPYLQSQGPLRIEAAGLECMNNNYKKVNVLYAKVKFENESDEHNLQSFANTLSSFFYDKGLAREDREVKLHMTLLNTKYKDKQERNNHNYRRKEFFDASTIMEKYKDFVFGKSEVNSIHLSLMGKVREDGYYQPIEEIECE